MKFRVFEAQTDLQHFASWNLIFFQFIIHNKLELLSSEVTATKLSTLIALSFSPLQMTGNFPLKIYILVAPNILSFEFCRD